MLDIAKSCFTFFLSSFLLFPASESQDRLLCGLPLIVAHKLCANYLSAIRCIAFSILPLLFLLVVYFYARFFFCLFVCVMFIILVIVVVFAL